MGICNGKEKIKKKKKITIKNEWKDTIYKKFDKSTKQRAILIGN